MTHKVYHLQHGLIAMQNITNHGKCFMRCLRFHIVLLNDVDLYNHFVKSIEINNINLCFVN